MFADLSIGHTFHLATAAKYSGRPLIEDLPLFSQKIGVRRLMHDFETWASAASPRLLV
jgi:hypothetical protein